MQKGYMFSIKTRFLQLLQLFSRKKEVIIHKRHFLINKMTDVEMLQWLEKLDVDLVDAASKARFPVSEVQRQSAITQLKDAVINWKNKDHRLPSVYYDLREARQQAVEL